MPRSGYQPCMKWKKLKNGSKFCEKSPSFASSRKVVLLIKIKIKIKILVVNILGIFEFKFCLEFLDTKLYNASVWKVNYEGHE